MNLIQLAQQSVELTSGSAMQASVLTAKNWIEEISEVEGEVEYRQCGIMLYQRKRWYCMPVFRMVDSPSKWNASHSRPKEWEAWEFTYQDVLPTDKVERLDPWMDYEHRLAQICRVLETANQPYKNAIGKRMISIYGACGDVGIITEVHQRPAAGAPDFLAPWEIIYQGQDEEPSSIHPSFCLILPEKVFPWITVQGKGALA